jgi:hypothetical protein
VATRPPSNPTPCTSVQTVSENQQSPSDRYRFSVEQSHRFREAHFGRVELAHCTTIRGSVCGAGTHRRQSIRAHAFLSHAATACQHHTRTSASPARTENMADNFVWVSVVLGHELRQFRHRHSVEFPPFLKHCKRRRGRRAHGIVGGATRSPHPYPTHGREDRQRKQG